MPNQAVVSPVCCLESLTKILDGTLTAVNRMELHVIAGEKVAVIGAGGLGQQIQIAISLFLENRLLTLILAIYLMVTLVDYFSASLRRRLL